MVPRGCSDGPSHAPCLRPLHRLLITSALQQDVAEAVAAAARAKLSRLAFMATTWYFAALFLLSTILTYRKIASVLSERFSLPQLQVVHNVAGWLWTSEYTSPTIALLLVCWWAALPVLFWKSGSRLLAAIMISFPLFVYGARSSDAALITLFGVEFVLQLLVPRR